MQHLPPAHLIRHGGFLRFSWMVDHTSPEPLPLPVRPADDRGSDGRAERVLVVEPGEEIATALRTAHGPDCFAPVSARGTVAGLAALAGEPFDSVVVDDRGGAGIEFCRRARAADARMPIILVAAAGDPVPVAALAAGADDVLRHPLDETELFVRLRAAQRIARLSADLAVERARSAAILDSLSDGLLMLADDGQILEANNRMAELVGIPRDRLIGLRPPFPFWPADGHGEYRASLEAALSQGAAVEIDRRYVDADGRDLDVILSVARMDGADDRRPRFLSTVKDVTRRRAAERALRLSESRHRALAREQARFSRIAAAVAADSESTIVFALVAREIAGLLGADAAAVTRFDGEQITTVGDWTDRSVRARLALARNVVDGIFAQVCDTGRAAHSQPTAGLGHEGEADPQPAAIRSPSGLAVPVRIQGRLWGALGAVNSRGGTFGPGSERRLDRFAALLGVAVTGAAARAELADQAHTDPLTGLANRRRVADQLADEVRAAHELSGPLAVVMVDIDHFKRVNDTHGHEVGDRVLSEVARRLVVGRRDGDLVARIGGEEFCLVLPGADAQDAVHAAERLRLTVASGEFETVGECTVSCGVAVWRSGDAPADLLRRADDALYRAKETGRNRVVAAADV